MDRQRKLRVEKLYTYSGIPGGPRSFQLSFYTQPRWAHFKGWMFHHVVGWLFYHLLPWRQMDRFATRRHNRRCVCDDFCTYIPPSNAVDLRCFDIGRRQRTFITRIEVDQRIFDRIKSDAIV